MRRAVAVRPASGAPAAATPRPVARARPTAQPGSAGSSRGIRGRRSPVAVRSGRPRARTTTGRARPALGVALARGRMCCHANAGLAGQPCGPEQRCLAVQPWRQSRPWREANPRWPARGPGSSARGGRHRLGRRVARSRCALVRRERGCHAVPGGRRVPSRRRCRPLGDQQPRRCPGPRGSARPAVRRRT